MFLGPRLVARSAVELAEAEVAVGDEEPDALEPQAISCRKSYSNVTVTCAGVGVRPM